MAGAASGGAYSAGVMDYLWEALNAWEAEKEAGNTAVPPWSVSLTDMSGTSAGGVTTTLATAALNTGYTPLPRGYKQGDAPPKNNPLFTTWVTEFSHDKLFQCHDLDSQPADQAVVSSLLYSHFIPETAKTVLNMGSIGKETPAWAKDICLALTTTNMRGVPYAVDDFTSTIDEDEQFHMRAHADYTQFLATTEPAKVSEADSMHMRTLDLSADRGSETWKHAIDCAAATAAFPIGFPTVKIQTPRSFYADRLNVKPNWSDDGEKDSSPYEYAAVDGGVVNNDPFRLLGRQMQARHGDSLESSGSKAWGSVLLVNPFPTERVDPMTVANGMPMVEMLMALLNSIRQQAAFKEAEFMDCLNEDNLERFLIRPDRKVKSGQQFALATNTLFAFGGLIDEKVRLHDFQLGRLNCKHFLEKTFVMKKEDALNNPIFKEHSEFLTEERIPIIPIVGTAAEPISQPKWPSYTDSERTQIIENVSGVIDVRMSKILNIYMTNLGIFRDASGNIGNWMMNQAAKYVRNRLQNKLNTTIREAIRGSMSVYVE